MPSPLGWLQVVEQDNILVGLSFVTRPRSSPLPGRVAQGLARSLERYFDGEDRDLLTVPLTTGTAFQRRTWAELQKIPYGQTASYRQIAVAIGKPTAYRAVAKAIASNPLVIVIPCHRVIRSDGKLGGYAGGLERKQRLLQLELVVKTCSLPKS